MTADLYDGPVGNVAPAEDRGDPDKPVISSQSHLCRRTVARRVQQRGDAGRWEIDVIYSFAALIQHLTDRQSYTFCTRTKSRALLCRKRPQETVSNMLLPFQGLEHRRLQPVASLAYHTVSPRLNLFTRGPVVLYAGSKVSCQFPKNRGGS